MSGADRDGYVLGVDLGTTHTAAAILRNGRTEIVPLGDHAPHVPSAIFHTTAGDLLIGESALRRGVDDPSRLAREFKRRVGDDTNIIVGGTPFSAHALMSQLLGWVLEHITLGQGAAPDLVVLTCPANWGPYRRELLEQAAAMAGLSSVRLCSEPEAAAVHFASTERVDPEQLVAVYDLGGGTFDAAVLRKEGSTDFTLLGTPEGIEHLGGLDFDTAVFEHVWRSLGPVDLDPDEPSVISALARLRRECTEAKEALSSDTDVAIAVSLGPIQRSVRLNRSELEDLIRPNLEHTVSALQRALVGADLNPEDLSAVVLIGGSARIPLVTDLLTQHLGRPVAISAQPKHSVALGAALTGVDSMTSYPEVRPALAEPAPTAPMRTSTPNEPPLPIQAAPAERRPRTKSRRRPSRRAALASGLLGVAAILFALVGAGADAVEFDLNRETGMAVAAAQSPTFTEESTMTLTLAGRELPGTDAARAQDGEFNLAGYKAYTAGPLRASVTDSGDSDAQVLVVPVGSSWWSRMLTIPGAAMVLLALFAFAYGESLLRPVVRGRVRGGAKTVLGMAGVGVVTGMVLVLTVWIVGLKLMTPFTLVMVVTLTVASAGLLPVCLRRGEPTPQRG